MERIILDENGKPWFAVEAVGTESPLRSGLQDTVANAVDGLRDVGDVIAKASVDIIDALQAGLGDAQPEEVKLTFGVTLGGEASIPLVSKASGEATFAVTVRWKPGR